MNMYFVKAFLEDGGRLFCARKYMCAFVCVGSYFKVEDNEYTLINYKGIIAVKL